MSKVGPSWETTFIEEGETLRLIIGHASGKPVGTTDGLIGPSPVCRMTFEVIPEENDGPTVRPAEAAVDVPGLDAGHGEAGPATRRLDDGTGGRQHGDGQERVEPGSDRSLLATEESRVRVPARKLGVHFPQKGTIGSAAYDLSSMETMEIGPGQTRIISTGLACAIPQGFALLITSRSGMASRGIVVANSPGIIDPDFRGQINVILRNENGTVWNVQRGDRVAQALLVRTYEPEWIEVDELPPTQRGRGQLGSTGR